MLRVALRITSVDCNGDLDIDFSSYLGGDLRDDTIEYMWNII